jgi:hypothetical protein
MSRDDDLDHSGPQYDDHDRPRRRAPQSNGAATAALVLGILSMCAGPLLGIPAIICGAIGMSRSKETGTGNGLALAGLLLGIIGMVVPILILIPAVSKVRQAAARAKDMNSEKFIVLGLHNYNDANNNRLPGPFARQLSDKPNPGLSWRVDILRYLGEERVYRQFKLDEAWDSASNRIPSNVSVMPYRSTLDPEDNQTRFRAFVGKGTAFEDETLGIPRSFTDGTSNTLLFVETADRVPWASPQDIPYQPGGPLPALGQPDQSVFLVAMVDGSVKSVKKSINPAILHALISRNGNEAIPANWDQ